MSNKNTVRLQDLRGRHLLSGVDFGSESAHSNEVDVANFILVRLDGKTYKFSENPSDGYRSMLGDVQIIRGHVKNTFPPVKVTGSWEDSDLEDILRLTRTTTGKVVLEVGTFNTDDYYPSFVANFNPKGL